MTSRPFPPAMNHGEIRELLPNVSFVTGTIGLPGPMPVRFSRNMVIVREGERLILVNSVRLTEAGLRTLDSLGKVTDVIRLAGFHGADDAFYKDRYGAKVWAIRGQRYTRGLKVDSTHTYFEPDQLIDKDTELPLAKASVYILGSKPAEAILVLSREGGIVVTGDSLQNWDHVDSYFSWFGGLMMKVMGFIKPHAVGPAWLKTTKPSGDDLRGILDLEFDHLLPAHGAPVLTGAKAAFRPAIERAAARIL